MGWFEVAGGGWWAVELERREREKGLETGRDARRGVQSRERDSESVYVCVWLPIRDLKR